MAESYPNGQKTLWEKEKLLIRSNFSFSHSIFKRLVSQGRQKVSLCGNGLNDDFCLSCDGKNVKNLGLYGRGLKKVIYFNSLLHDKMLNLSKFNAFADDIVNGAIMAKSVCASLENLVVKEENAGYQHFLLFPPCFRKLFFSGSLKVRIV